MQLAASYSYEFESAYREGLTRMLLAWGNGTYIIDFVAMRTYYWQNGRQVEGTFYEGLRRN